MTQKVLKVGSSAAVTISSQALKELGIAIGDEVITSFDAKSRTLTVKPANKKTKLTGEDLETLKIGESILRRYHSDFKLLADK